MDSMDFTTIQLNRHEGNALYLQLCGALERAIVAGDLVPGERLPSERDMAILLGVSRTTAVNAYRELEARGLVRGHVGRGTFVSAGPDTSGAPFAWRGKVAVGALRTEDPSLRWLAGSSGNRELISFAAAVAAPECMPVEIIGELVEGNLRRRGSAAMLLGPTEGMPELRRAIAARRQVRPEQVLVLSGAQQGLDLIARCLLDPGDTVIIDRPGYLGAIQTFRAAGAHLAGWDVERADFEELEDLILRYRPKFLYTNPTFQNPTGQTMPVPVRRELLELAARYRLPVVEDDPYSELSFDGQRVTSLYELDPYHLVIYIGTFSKVLAAGLRLGWLMASEAIIDQLALIKQRNDVSSQTLGQLVVAGFITGGHLDRHLITLRHEHRQRYRAMCASIERHLTPGQLSYLPVDGGMYLWCTLRAGVDAVDLLRAASANGVIFAIGEIFNVDGGGRHRVRLSFSSVPSEAIDEGVRRLGVLLDAQPLAHEIAGTIPIAR
jgi:2-aminoadipate transaminase